MGDLHRGTVRIPVQISMRLQPRFETGMQRVDIGQSDRGPGAKLGHGRALLRVGARVRLLEREAAEDLFPRALRSRMAREDLFASVLQTLGQSVYGLVQSVLTNRQHRLTQVLHRQ